MSAVPADFTLFHVAVTLAVEKSAMCGHGLSARVGGGCRLLCGG